MKVHIGDIEKQIEKNDVTSLFPGMTSPEDNHKRKERTKQTKNNQSERADGGSVREYLYLRFESLGYAHTHTDTNLKMVDRPTRYSYLVFISCEL